MRRAHLGAPELDRRLHGLGVPRRARAVIPDGARAERSERRQLIVFESGRAPHQFITTRLYRNQSDDEALPVTYAPTRSAQFKSPPTATPIRFPHGPLMSRGRIARDAWAML